MHHMPSAPGVGPHVNAKPSRKAGYRHYFGPRVAREDVVDDRVVDPGRIGGGTERPVTNGGSKVQSDPADDFGVGVGAGSVGPVSGVLTRPHAFGSGHETTLGAVGSAERLTRPPVSSNDVGSNQHERLDPTLAKYVDDYTPAKIPAAEWTLIAEFVRQTVRDARPDRKMTAKRWLNATAYFVHWCSHVCCLPLDAEAMFRPEHISRYVAEVIEAEGRSRATIRHHLRSIAAHLGIEPDIEDDYEYKSFGRKKGSVPYTAKQMADIRIYATTMENPYKSHTLTGLLTYGCGAGLRPEELLPLRSSDIEFTDDGVFVNVGGKFPRRVPLLADFEDLARAHMAKCEDGFVILPKREQRGPMVVANFLYTCEKSPMRPNMQRLRSTWIVAQLNARVPFPVLMRGAGVASLSAFDRYLSYVDQTEPTEADSLLRGESRA